LAQLVEGTAAPKNHNLRYRHRSDIIVSRQFSRASLLSWIDNLAAVLDSLRKQYDVIIVDTPPSAPLPKASLLASHGDATVLAVRCANDTTRGAQTDAQKLGDAGAVVSGAALTLVQEDIKEAYGLYRSQVPCQERCRFTLSPSRAVTWPTTTARSWAGLPACAPESLPLRSGSRPKRDPRKLRSAVQPSAERLPARTTSPIDKRASGEPGLSSAATASKEQRRRVVTPSHREARGCALVICGVQQDFTSPSRWYSPPQAALGPS